MCRPISTFAAIAALVSALCVPSVFAEHTRPLGFTLSPSVGKYFFDDELPFDDTNFLSLGVGYQLTQQFGFELSYMKADEVEGSTSEVDYSQWQLDGLFSLPGTESVSPYVVLGFGDSEMEIDQTSFNSTMMNMGLGVQYWLTDQLTIRGDLRRYINFDEELQEAALRVGLSYTFGSVSQPISTPAPTPVATPIATPKPTIIGDQDRDGVLDNVDQCPETHPNVSVDSNGCELDTDGDGVVDRLDSCPDTAKGAKVDEKGCYILIKETQKIELKVNFASNSAVVPEESMADIQSVAEFLVQYPLTDAVVEGHTDDTGAAAYNKALSQRRASAVRDVLINRFNINADRVTAIGYGEEKPIASNKTREGRAKNRRVVAVMTASVTKRVDQ